MDGDAKNEFQVINRLQLNIKKENGKRRFEYQQSISEIQSEFRRNLQNHYFLLYELSMYIMPNLNLLWKIVI